MHSYSGQRVGPAEPEPRSRCWLSAPRFSPPYGTSTRVVSDETTNNAQYRPEKQRRFRCRTPSTFRTKPKARAVWEPELQGARRAAGHTELRRRGSPGAVRPTVARQWQRRASRHPQHTQRPDPVRTSPRCVPPRFQERRATQKRGTRRPRAPQPARHGRARLRFTDRAFRGHPRERRPCPPPRPGPPHPRLGARSDSGHKRSGNNDIPAALLAAVSPRPGRAPR